ncbi:hypothetical protein JOC75_001015 [Metabacillus crassostreae]|uniref:hypothetical protein n=1 Tax=Metabacillus crassostreae TaxID=929098 RepID=UPI001959A4DC|nr:hypothetical protein [Metabacillus crassostreae]MBM7603045.1 hypothetical protein [Metabacillus crassostreae]
MAERTVDVLKVVELIARKIDKEGIPFVFAGSVSSLIQGCDITPGDIDILVPQSIQVHKIALILSEYLMEESNDPNTRIETWVATTAMPVKKFVDYASNEWTFSRLFVDGVKLEIANIQPVNNEEYINGSGFWENGPHIWQHTILIPFKDIELPIIPLEIQLETNMNRNLESRINEIIKVIRSKGYNEKLIDYALNQTNRKKFQEIISNNGIKETDFLLHSTILHSRKEGR